VTIAARTKQSASVLCADPKTVSIKRLAWAFGCAKRDSEEEQALYVALVERVLKSRHAREGT